MIPPALEQLLRQAEAMQAAGRLADAARLSDQALAAEPEHPRALLVRAASAVGMGDVPMAKQTLRRLLERDKDSFEARIWLGGILLLEGDAQAAQSLAREAAELRPAEAAGHLLLGRCHLRRGEAEDAARAIQFAVERDPSAAVAYHMLGQAYQEGGYLPEAAEALRRAIHLAPAVPDSWIALAQVLLWMGERAEAVASLYQAYRLEPGSARGLTQLAKAQFEEGDFAAAEATLRIAIERFPTSAAPAGVLGTLLWQSGRFEQAMSELERAIRLRPGIGQPYCDLVQCRKLDPGALPLIEQMEARLRSDLASDDRRLLHYALGKAYGDLQAFADSMRHFDEANRIMHRFSYPKFDAGWYDTEFAAVAARFTAERIGHGAPGAATAESPVFVVGMIRSGTTLTDQILSRHPEVSSIGECRFWPTTPDSNALTYGRIPLDLVRAARLGEEYVKLLRERSDDDPRVVDKMPLNFVYLGLIHLALPNARIIHCRRNPLDNAVSMFTTPFPEPVSFAHTRANIAGFYRVYFRLMQHWRQVLPADRFFEVDYEDLVADPERVTRRMIEFLGLEWSDECLHPEANPRNVRTPSAWQTRQPIYRSSVNRWRNYEPWLGELRELGELRHPR